MPDGHHSGTSEGMPSSLGKAEDAALTRTKGGRTQSPAGASR